MLPRRVASWSSVYLAIHTQLNRIILAVAQANEASASFERAEELRVLPGTALYVVPRIHDVVAGSHPRKLKMPGPIGRRALVEIAPVAVRGVTASGEVEIRRIEASDADFEAVTRLLAELGRPAPVEERLPALRRTYDQHVARADTASRLALLDGAPVGFVSLEFREPFFTTRPQAWIPDLIVTESARGRDIGAALLDAALAEASARGAYAAVLESGHQRAAAHRLYLAAGMEDVGSFFTLAR